MDIYLKRALDSCSIKIDLITIVSLGSVEELNNLMVAQLINREADLSLQGYC
jgi:hypothetical protein